MNNCKRNKEDITMKLKLIRKTRKAYAETCLGGSSPSLCKSQNITSTINKDHCVPADVKRPFEIVNGNRFGVLCQSLLDIAYDSSCRIKAGVLFLIQQQYHDVLVEGMRNQSIC